MVTSDQPGLTPRRVTRSAAGSGARGRNGVVLALLAVLIGCDVEQAPIVPRPQEEADLLGRMLEVEDSRAISPDDLRPLGEGLLSEVPELRRFAVRAAGRLERDYLVPEIGSLLADPDAGVRREAANALAQASFRSDGGPARALLLSRLAIEPDTEVRSVIAQSVGRTRHPVSSDAEASVAAILASVGREPGSPPRFDLDFPVVKGFYFLSRQAAIRIAMPEAAVAWLHEFLTVPAPSGDAMAGRARALALATLSGVGRATTEDVTGTYGDFDPFVRRQAIISAPVLADRDAALDLVTRGLADPAPQVRVEAIRGWPRVARSVDCEPYLRLARDRDGHVALEAIGALGTCGSEPVSRLLDSLAASLPSVGATDGGWQRAAQALVSLVTVDGDLAAENLPAFVGSMNRFVRAYAARVAGVLPSAETLDRLVADDDPLVRTAALEGLMNVRGRAADPVLIEQLGSSDPQLIQVAAGLLQGTRDPGALPALLTTIERLTAERRETARDARLAVLERIDELGSAAEAGRLTPLLTDFDPRVAARAAAALSRWTGIPAEARPEPIAPASPPTPAELDALDGAVFVVEMVAGGTFEVRLLAWDAPTNANRFARLADAGYYDGLTFHRVVANFVLQGGSPDANEYSGDGPFTRDEVGLVSNWRGTIGVSTRGRDTGDGQMFINLVDNVRLDHDYTVFAEVAGGMDVVDQLLEGATIRRIRRAR